MIKLVRQLIGLAVFAAIVFLVLAFWQGGNPFRWFGERSEEAGIVLKKKSEVVGAEADKIKKKTDEIRGTTKKVGAGIKKTGDKIKEFAGSKTEKQD